jgi:hypothetical protein
MTSADDKPRRKRVRGKGNTGIYEHADGQLEIGYPGPDGRTKWEGPFTGIMAARTARAIAVAKRAQGGGRTPRDPRMTFADGAEAWWEGHASTLADSTRDVYRRHLDIHLLPAFGERRMSGVHVDDVAR